YGNASLPASPKIAPASDQPPPNPFASCPTNKSGKPLVETCSRARNCMDLEASASSQPGAVDGARSANNLAIDSINRSLSTFIGRPIPSRLPLSIFHVFRPE